MLKAEPLIACVMTALPKARGLTDREASSPAYGTLTRDLYFRPEGSRKPLSLNFRYV